MANFFSRQKKGFTLIELVVVAGIIGGIMLVVTFNSRKFTDKISLKSAVTEVSLAMRQAQNFGVSVKESSSNQFNAPYGIVFDLSNPTYAFIYSDANNNRTFNGAVVCAGSDECVERISFRGGVTVNLLCATKIINNDLDCFNSTARYMVLTYVRPNPEPIITVFRADGSQIFDAWKKVYVGIRSQQGVMMYVVTDSVSGQITVQNNIP